MFMCVGVSVRVINLPKNSSGVVCFNVLMFSCCRAINAIFNLHACAPGPGEIGTVIKQPAPYDEESAEKSGCFCLREGFHVRRSG